MGARQRKVTASAARSAVVQSEVVRQQRIGRVKTRQVAKLEKPKNLANNSIHQVCFLFCTSCIVATYWWE